MARDVCRSGESPSVLASEPKGSFIATDEDAHDALHRERRVFRAVEEGPEDCRKREGRVALPHFMSAMSSHGPQRGLQHGKLPVDASHQAPTSGWGPNCPIDGFQSASRIFATWHPGPWRNAYELSIDKLDAFLFFENQAFASGGAQSREDQKSRETSFTHRSEPKLDYGDSQ